MKTLRDVGIVCGCWTCLFLQLNLLAILWTGEWVCGKLCRIVVEGVTPLAKAQRRARRRLLSMEGEDT